MLVGKPLEPHSTRAHGVVLLIAMGTGSGHEQIFSIWVSEVECLQCAGAGQILHVVQLIQDAQGMGEVTGSALKELTYEDFIHVQHLWIAV